MPLKSSVHVSPPESTPLASAPPALSLPNGSLALRSMNEEGGISASVDQGAATPTESDPPFRNLSQWFTQEIHAHDQQLKSYLRGSFPTVRDVEDLVQESYLRVWRRQAIQPIKSAKAFLFTIARRLAIDWIRHDRVEAIDEVEDLASLAVYDYGNSAADAVSRAEIIELFIDAIDALPARCREIVILRKFKLLSARETALRLGVREHTVEMQLTRGNARIRAYLAARGITRTLGHEG